MTTKMRRFLHDIFGIHEWNYGEPYKRAMVHFGGLLAGEMLGKEIAHGINRFQDRTCVICGLVEQIDLDND